MLTFEKNKYLVDYKNIEFPQVSVAEESVTEEPVVARRHRGR